MLTKRVRRLGASTLIQNVLLAAATGIIIAGVILFATHSKLLDFTIYYEAGRRLLVGASPYSWYGPHSLPYQYVPWVLWLFLPLCVLPIQVAWLLFVVICFLLQAVVLRLLLRLFKAQLSIFQAGLLYALSLAMGLLALYVGQVSSLQLTAIVAVMVLCCVDRPWVAGIMFPFVLIKPQLVILSVPALWWAGERRMVVASLVALAVIISVATVLIPNWIQDSLRVIVAGQARSDVLAWNFTTMPSFFGLGREWNFRFSAVLIPIGMFVAYRYRYLPRDAWLAIVIALSLAVAPYSFAYDLLLLLPALVWCSRRWSLSSLALWLAAASIPIVARYSSGAYLATILVIACAIWRAHTLNNELAEPQPMSHGSMEIGS